MPVARPLLAMAPALLAGHLWATAHASAQAMGEPCAAPGAEVRIDHVVTAVGDLDDASATYRALGFTLKEGRRHDNGLLNRHVKFRDGTALELMSLDGPATDAMAREYEAALHGGEGGVFLAITGTEEAVVKAASELGVPVRRFQEGPFGYVTFPDPGMQAVFALRYASGVEDADSVLSHRNGSTGIREVWVEATAELGGVLLALGARPCGVDAGPDGREAEVYAVGGGRVALLPVTPGARPRVVGVVLAGPSGPDGRGGGDRVHGLRVEIGGPR